MVNEPSRLELLVDILKRAGVEFIVVGRQAEWLFGSPRVTYDIDICYRKTTENLQRLAEALKELDPRLRNAPPDLPFTLDAKSLALGDDFTFVTTLGDVDLLGYLEPIGTYEQLIARAEKYPLGQHIVDAISLQDLIRVKRHINRPKDRESLLQLLAIERVRAEQSAEGA